MADLGALRVHLTSNNTKFNRGMQGGIKRLVSFKRAAVAAGAVAGAAMVKMSVDSIRAFGTQEKAEKKLRATLRATGYAAGFTSSELIKFAEQMSASIGVADEDIISSMGILATFKNVAGDTFKETTALAFDMAAVMGTDARSAFVQLGKAINDPAGRMGALAEAGVTFTEQQKEQIRALQESGDMLGAQAVLMKELRSEFGGAAAEMADAEPWKRVTNAVGDLSEALGKVLTITLELDGAMGSATDGIRGWTSAISDGARGFAVSIKTIWIEIKFALKQVSGLIGTMISDSINNWKEMFRWLRDSWKTNWEAVVQIGKNAWEMLKKAIRGEDIDLADILQDVKEIDLPRLKLGIDLDQIEAIDREREKALARLEKEAISAINKEGARELKEQRAVAAKAAPKATLKTTSPTLGATSLGFITEQFAGALERGTVAAYSAGLGRSISADTPARETAENTSTMVEQLRELIGLLGLAPQTETMLIGMSRGN